MIYSPLTLDADTPTYPTTDLPTYLPTDISGYRVAFQFLNATKNP